MARIARWILRYHGCTQELANELITGTRPISAWPQSKHPYDWLGLGIYFWEHGPERAMRWAQDKHRASAATVGATIQLDHCFDLLDVGFTGELLPAYQLEQQEAETIGRSLPLNRGRDADLGGRYLDCLVINRCLRASPEFQAVRGAFQEGEIEGLRRALNAMQGWSAARRLQYQVTLGVKNRKAEYTQDFGGEAMPEPDNIAMIVVPASGSLPLIKLLYVLRQCDDLCLNAPTARSIIRAQSMIDPCIVQLLRVIKDAEDAGLVRRTAPAGRDLVEADRDSIIAVTLTDQGKRYLDDVLYTGATGGDGMPRAASARGT